MHWYYDDDGLQIGPLTDTEFQQKVQIGKVNPQTMVWNESMTQWQTYGSLSPAAPPPLPEVRVTRYCSQCGGNFSDQDMIQYQGRWVCSNCKAGFFQSVREGTAPMGVGVWRRLNKLVMSRNAELPDRCVKCNAPAGGIRLTRKLYWHPPAWYLLICAGILIYAIAALIVRKQATIQVGLCQQHFLKRKRDIAITWSLVGAMLLSFILAIAKFPMLSFLGLALLIAAVAYGIVTLQPVTPNKITDQEIWLNGVNKAYLDLLPEFHG